MSTTPGLRERKKEATRQALHQAAVRLAVENGLERVTIDAIADAATVSRRTFSNYFASKEDAILHREAVTTRRLLELLAARPAAEGPWTALSQAAIALFGEIDAGPEDVARLRLLRHHPALLSRQVSTYAQMERALREVLMTRTPTLAELTAQVIAATVLTTVRVAVQAWGERPEESLQTLVASALAVIGGAQDRGAGTPA